MLLLRKQYLEKENAVSELTTAAEKNAKSEETHNGIEKK